MMRHDLSINLGKDGLRGAIEKLINCYREDEEAEHEYYIDVVDLHEEDDEKDDNIFFFNNFPDAIKLLATIYKALRIGYKAGEKGSIDV